MAQTQDFGYRYGVLNNVLGENHILDNEDAASRQLFSVDVQPGQQSRGKIKPAYVQVSEKDLDTRDKKTRPQKSLWRPTSLRRTTLASFIVVFCLILAALEVLKQYSDAHQGLTTTSQGRHYLWTYGPTASECSRSLDKAPTNIHSTHYHCGFLATYRVSVETGCTMAGNGPWLRSCVEDCAP
jgi:hypothetical protein